MKVLITCGTGKTGSALAHLLHSTKIDFLITTRSGVSPGLNARSAVLLNWEDPKTFENPFLADSNIDRVYLVVPHPGLASNVRSFIKYAASKGVQRYVLLDGSQEDAGAVLLEGLPQFLAESGLEYTILRPTWFQENFGTSLLSSIRDDSELPSATGDGRVAFVSTKDVAQAAFSALTDSSPLPKDLWIFGPELFSYKEVGCVLRESEYVLNMMVTSQVAQLLSQILGREITMKKQTVEELKSAFISYGFTEEVADALADMESGVARHVEEQLFHSTGIRKVVGKFRLQEYIMQNVESWMKP